MKKVKVYTKNNCAQCTMTKKQLEKHKIDFKLINVEEDEEALEYVKNELGFSSMPVVVAEGFEPFAGFQPDKLEKLKEDN